MRKLPKIYSSQGGLTLIELLVVVLILGALLFIAILTLDPVAQLHKSSDAQRRSDIEQIRQALDTYYNDHNCYPKAITFNQQWAENGVVYMQKVPQDSSCSGSSPHCYLYQTDNTSNCPQWNVVYGYLTQVKASQVTDSCPVKTICGSMTLKYNFCLTSGNIDCTYINSNPLPTPVLPPTPTLRPTLTPVPPTPTSLPTQAPGQCSCATARYDTRPFLCNDVGVGAWPPARYCDRNCTQLCF